MCERKSDQSPAVDRRRFLSYAASACAGGAIAGRLAAAAEGAGSPWKMRLAGSSINFSSLPIEEAAARIAALGFDAIDVWSAHAGCPHLDDVLGRLGPEGLKELLQKNKLDLYSFSVYQGGYPKYAELLGKAGGGVAVRGSRKVGSDNLAADVKALLEELKPEIELAEKHDSYLAIENHGGALLNKLDSFKALVDQNTSSRLGIALAPYHVQRQNESVAEAIRICGPQLFFFYAWQNAPGVEQLPGIGPADCEPWIAELAGIDFRWPVTPFMHHEPESEAMSASLARSRDYLKKCYAKTVAK
jgi:sugar phosphate isomerase/epimerase